MKNHAQAFGEWAEQYSLSYLIQQGFHCVTQHYQCRYGEIDLIVQRDLELVFVEVKARAKTQYAHAIDVISMAKQRKMMRTALIFLDQHPQYQQHYARFDVICLDQLPNIRQKPIAPFLVQDYQLQWIENAFTFAPELINL